MMVMEPSAGLYWYVSTIDCVGFEMLILVQPLPGSAQQVRSMSWLATVMDFAGVAIGITLVSFCRLVYLCSVSYGSHMVQLTCIRMFHLEGSLCVLLDRQHPCQLLLSGGNSVGSFTIWLCKSATESFATFSLEFFFPSTSFSSKRYKAHTSHLLISYS